MASIPRAVCLPCEAVMKIEKNNVSVEVKIENGAPYFKVYGDLYKCPSCGTETIGGWALRPFLYPFDEEYEDYSVDLTVQHRRSP